MAGEPGSCVRYSDELPLPPGPFDSDSLKQSTETPVEHDRSFFVDRVTKCPVDDTTGMPLPIAPRSDINSLAATSVNEHHHFYPRLSPVLRNTLGGRALRVSRIQRVGIEQHNFGEHPFHKFFPEGPDIPSDPDSQLGLCVLACAGFLPQRVVDTSGSEPEIREMKDWEHRRLSAPNAYASPLPFQVKRFRDRRFPSMTLKEAKAELIDCRRKQAEHSYKNLIYGFDPMKKFMTERVFAQDLSSVDARLVRRFLRAGDSEAGLCLLAIGAMFAAEAATVNGEPADDVYKRLQQEGRLHNRMPPSPSTLIKNKLGHIPARLELLAGLRLKLLEDNQSRVA